MYVAKGTTSCFLSGLDNNIGSLSFSLIVGPFVNYRKMAVQAERLDLLLTSGLTTHMTFGQKDGPGHITRWLVLLLCWLSRVP